MQKLMGENIPRAKITNAGYYYLYRHNPTGISNEFPYTGNKMVLGSWADNDIHPTGVLSPEEAWGIDKKLDDGRPAYGTVISFNWENCTTATDRDELTHLSSAFRPSRNGSSSSAWASAQAMRSLSVPCASGDSEGRRRSSFPPHAGHSSAAKHGIPNSHAG